MEDNLGEIKSPPARLKAMFNRVNGLYDRPRIRYGFAYLHYKRYWFPFADMDKAKWCFNQTRTYGGGGEQGVENWKALLPFNSSANRL